MKKTITLLSIAFSIFATNAQTVADFETFTLSTNSAYSPPTSTPFQTSNASFQYSWDNAFSFWSGGFSYTNKNDSVTAGFGNIYGVRPGKGYNASDIYVVGQDRGVITLSAPHNTVNGFYITNTTYAYKSMAKGDMFARKFGDTTGTGSGTTIAQGSYPDFFKVIVKGYKNGVLKNDSVVVMLADFTYTNNTQDFILSTWEYINTSAIGTVDSIKFFMRSSDEGAFGMNTPAFFAIDNFETSAPNPVGMTERTASLNMSAYPNPFNTSITVSSQIQGAAIKLMDITCKLVYSEIMSAEISVIELSSFESGIYFLELSSGDQKTIKKLIKN